MRFWGKLKVDSAGCWVWVMGKTSDGYGQFHITVKGGKDRNVLAHRHAYTMLVGNVPQGLCLDHLCRVRACCNPAHLEVVTYRTNILRGVGLAAKNVQTTHCPKGHEYSAENTRMGKLKKGDIVRSVVRICRQCARIREAHRPKRVQSPDYYQRNKEKILSRKRNYYHRNKEAILARQRKKLEH